MSGRFFLVFVKISLFHMSHRVLWIHIPSRHGKHNQTTLYRTRKENVPRTVFHTVNVVAGYGNIFKVFFQKAVGKKIFYFHLILIFYVKFKLLEFNNFFTCFIGYHEFNYRLDRVNLIKRPSTEREKKMYHAP